MALIARYTGMQATSALLFAAERPLLMLRTEFAPGITGPNAGNHVPSIKKKTNNRPNEPHSQ